MTPERWAQIEEVFQAALDCAPEIRAALVEEKCGRDAELLIVVEKLINQHETGKQFLESSVWNEIFLTNLTDEFSVFQNQNSVGRQADDAFFADVDADEPQNERV